MSNAIKLREEPLCKQHNRKEFDCGNAELNDFFSRYARQAHDKNTAKTYVAVDISQQKIAGFYSLTVSSLTISQLPEHLQKGLGKHPVPLFVLARLAVDIAYQGQGIGGTLLVKALQRCKNVANEVGGIGLLIEAKNEQVANWYQTYGAISLPDHPLILIIPFSMLD